MTDVFRSIHLALPVRSIDEAVSFFRAMMKAEVIVMEKELGRCTVAYDRFEFSLFEMQAFEGWTKRDFGPFHIGHELQSRSEVDQLHSRALTAKLNIVCSPFDRSDGDYAFFVRDPQGIVFEFFCGGHVLSRAATS